MDGFLGKADLTKDRKKNTIWRLYIIKEEAEKQWSTIYPWR